MIFRSLGHFSENNKSFKIYLNSRKHLLRQQCVTVTSAGQQTLLLVKPDVWGPHVSDTGLFNSLTGGTGQRPRQLGQLRRVGPLWLT